MALDELIAPSSKIENQTPAVLSSPNINKYGLFKEIDENGVLVTGWKNAAHAHGHANGCLGTTRPEILTLNHIKRGDENHGLPPHMLFLPQMNLMVDSIVAERLREGICFMLLKHCMSEKAKRQFKHNVETRNFNDYRRLMKRTLRAAQQWHPFIFDAATDSSQLKNLPLHLQRATIAAGHATYEDDNEPVTPERAHAFLALAAFARSLGGAMIGDKMLYAERNIKAAYETMHFIKEVFWSGKKIVVNLEATAPLTLESSHKFVVAILEAMKRHGYTKASFTASSAGVGQVTGLLQHGSKNNKDGMPRRGINDDYGVEISALLLAGAPPMEEPIELLPGKEIYNRDVPGVFYVGLEDPTFEITGYPADRIASLIKQQKMSMELQPFQGGHGFPVERILKDLARIVFGRQQQPETTTNVTPFPGRPKHEVETPEASRILAFA